jgi:hypothetical protein
LVTALAFGVELLLRISDQQARGTGEGFGYKRRMFVLIIVEERSSLDTKNQEGVLTSKFLHFIIIPLVNFRLCLLHVLIIAGSIKHLPPTNCPKTKAHCKSKTLIHLWRGVDQLPSKALAPRCLPC